MKGISIEIGTRINLTFNELGMKHEEYYSKIIDVKENYIIMDDPIHKSTKKTKFFPVGTSLLASIVGSDEAVYQFPTKIAARLKLKIPAFAIPTPKQAEIRRIQRREFVRIDATVDIAVHRKNGNEAFTSVTSDISGGGLSIIIPKNAKLEMDENIDIWLTLGFHSGKYHYIHTAAKVVFTQLKNGIHTASIKFLSLSSKEQQLIVSYCFEKQREMRKKELS